MYHKIIADRRNSITNYIRTLYLTFREVDMTSMSINEIQAFADTLTSGRLRNDMLITIAERYLLSFGQLVKDMERDIVNNAEIKARHIIAKKKLLTTKKNRQREQLEIRIFRNELKRFIPEYVQAVKEHLLHLTSTIEVVQDSREKQKLYAQWFLLVINLDKYSNTLYQELGHDIHFREYFLEELRVFLKNVFVEHYRALNLLDVLDQLESRYPKE